MSDARAAEVLEGILADLKDLNKGPGENVPVKTVWLRAVERGVMSVQDVTNALHLGGDQGLFTHVAGGPGGMGSIALTQPGYDRSRA